MLKTFFKTLMVTSFVTCGLSPILPDNSFGMYVIDEESSAGTIVKRYVADLQEAERVHQQGATEKTIARLTKGYAATEAASRTGGARNSKEAYTIAEKYAANLREWERIHGQGPTKETIARLTKGYAATEAASRVANAMGRTERIRIKEKKWRIDIGPIPIWEFRF